MGRKFFAGGYQNCSNWVRDLQQLGQIIAMGNCHVVEEREREQKIRAQIGLTWTRKEVSSKFITSLVLAILEGRCVWIALAT